MCVCLLLLLVFFNCCFDFLPGDQRLLADIAASVLDVWSFSVHYGMEILIACVFIVRINNFSYF